MATRTGMGTGVAVALTLLALASVAGFITTVIFISKYSEKTRELRQAQANIENVIRQGELNSDDVRALTAEAGASSLVTYMIRAHQENMRRVIGTEPRRNLTGELASRLERVEGAGNTSLLNVLGARDREISNLRTQVTQADAARTTALADLSNEVDRTRRAEAAHAATVARLSADVEQYKQEVDRYRQEVVAARADMDARVDKVRQDYEDQLEQARSSLRDAQQQVLVLQEQIARLREANQRNIFRGASEEALVDARVVALDPTNNAVVIGRGSRDKLVIGMTFAVYDDAASIRPDPRTGEYPPGKATVEVIGVDENSARCRIIRETRGNPVVRGDVVANAIYDPGKTYKFVVFGDFDTNRDGRSTAQERDLLVALIGQWGGVVVDDLEGDVDFLVLGSRPVVPPRPGIGQPIEVVREWMRLDQGAQRYDRLLEQARATSIPVLSQNRLYTLVGR
jgi:hypothetical protein